MSTKLLIIGGGIFVFLVIVAGIFIFISRPQNLSNINVPGSSVAPQKNGIFSFLPLEPFTKSNQPPQANQAAPSPVISGVPSELQSIFPSQSELQRSLNNISGSVAPAVSPTPFVKLSDQQIFNRIWPSSYLDQLNSAQDFLIKQGFIKSEDKLELNSTQNIIGFLSKGIDYLESTNVISSSSAVNFKSDLAGSFLQRKNLETSLLQKYGGYTPPQPSPYPTPIIYPAPSVSPVSSSGKDYMTLGRAIRNIIAQTFSGIPGPTDAVAQLGVLPTSCYAVRKPGIPGCVGVTLWAPNCDDWFFIFKLSPVPTGCLNAICPFGNAIWDAATGQCGCDQWLTCGIPFGGGASGGAGATGNF